MKIEFNGEIVNINFKNLEEYINSMNLSRKGLVVLYNDNIIKDDEFVDVELRESDRVEVLSFVAGG